MPRATWLAVLLCAAVALLPAPASAEGAASVSLSLVGRGNAPAGDPRASLYVLDHVRPGSTAVRRVRIGNTGDRPLAVRTYVAAAEVADGTFHALADDAANDLTRWTTTSRSRVVVPAGGSRGLSVRIAVPAGAEPGERYGVVWAAVSATTSTGEVVNRVGLRLYVSVGPGDAPGSRLAVRTVAAGRTRGGRPYLEVTVADTGGRAAEPVGTVVLDRAPGGLPPERVSIGGRALAPGEAARLRAALPRDLEDGPWRATVTIEANGVRAVARARVTLPSEVGTIGPRRPAVPVAPGRSPVPAVVAVLLLLLVGGALLRRVRAA